MRKGKQNKADFDYYAAWGYVSAKFAQRAEMSYEATRSALTRNLSFQRVISLGGGPGNDLFGAMVAIEEQALMTIPTPETEIKYFCFDWVDVWTPIVNKVGSLCNRNITAGHCDLTLPVNDVENEEVLSAMHGDECFFLLSFVILESSAVLANELIETCPRSTFVILDAGQGQGSRRTHTSGIRSGTDGGEKHVLDGDDNTIIAEHVAHGDIQLCGSLSQFAAQECGRDVQLLYHRDELVGVLLAPVLPS